MIKTDEMVKFLHEGMKAMSANIAHARRSGLRMETDEEQHDMYAAIKNFITTHEDKITIDAEHKSLAKYQEGILVGRMMAHGEHSAHCVNEVKRIERKLKGLKQ